MDFDLSKDQLDIKKAAREFAEGEFPEIAEMCDREEKYPAGEPVPSQETQRDPG